MKKEIKNQSGKVYIKVFWLASIIVSVVGSILLTIIVNLFFNR